jgi:hypothetical protein
MQKGKKKSKEKETQLGANGCLGVRGSSIYKKLKKHLKRTTHTIQERTTVTCSTQEHGKGGERLRGGKNKNKKNYYTRKYN